MVSLGLLVDASFYRVMSSFREKGSESKNALRNEFASRCRLTFLTRDFAPLERK